VKKLYLAASEIIDSGGKVDIFELEKKIFERNNPIPISETTPTTSGEPNQGGGGEGGGEGEEKKPRKRKNRWGTAPTSETIEFAPINPAASDFQPFVPVDQPSSAALPPCGEEQNGGEEGKKVRRSRWSTAPPAAPMSDPSPAAFPSPSIPSVPFTLTPEIMQQTLVLQMQLKQLNDKLLTVVQDAAIEELNPNRPPSPPPKYDAYGKRLNTREVRMKETLSAQRTAVIEQMMKINPLFQVLPFLLSLPFSSDYFFQPPADFVRQKPFRRLFIPYREYPNYNFIGLIIGPRGNTQKKMERETGCKISIRGRGSVKEGSKGRATKNNLDDDEDLHCHVQGETEESVCQPLIPFLLPSQYLQVELAAKLIKELLTPVDDDKNEHKQKQLRELALINGTLREDEYCTICGEKGHRPFECPQRTKTFQAANVRCAICGDQSHPTRDCPMKQVR
jgi:splicing factor 1